MTLKPIVIKLDKETRHKIETTAKTQHITKSQVIRDAILAYYQVVPKDNPTLINVLQNQIKDLQQERDRLQQIAIYYAQPWYKRLFVRPQLTDHK